MCSKTGNIDRHNDELVLLEKNSYLRQSYNDMMMMR